MWGFATSQAGDVDVIAGSQTAASGTVVFSNSNNVTFGMSNSSVVTASVGSQTLSFWDNIYEPEGLNAGTSHGSLYFVPLQQLMFPGAMTLSTLHFDVSASAGTSAHSYSLQLGIYTISASSTLALLNSVQTSWGFAATSNMSTRYVGMRFITIHSSLWSAQPVFSQTQYILGINILSAGAALSMSFIGQQVANPDQRSGTLGTSTATNISMGQYPYYGMVTATTNAMPASIGITALARTVTVFQPHLIFDNLVGSF